MKNPFKMLTRFELFLWIGSLLVVLVSSLLSPTPDVFSTVASLVGVTSLIFIARGFAVGQALIIVFATMYALLSLEQSYYGELITYAGMTLPMAVVSLIAWLRNPNGSTGEVKVRRLNARMLISVGLLSLVVTVVFYFVLSALDTASLAVSTFSVATSFFAAMLTALRSPYYALAYAVNDIVLVVLWTIAAVNDPGAYSVVACFVTFLVNDLYGFISWIRMAKAQSIQQNVG